MNTVYQNLLESKSFLESKTSLRPMVGVVLGSGLGSFANQINVECEIPFEAIPHFAKPRVAGHGGRIVMGKISGIPIYCQQGRVHYYEGHDLETVVHPARTMAMLGIKTVILTNAAGGLHKDMTPGDLMVIRDHINFSGVNPLRGTNVDELGPRFPDMTKIYSPRILQIFRDLYEELKIRHLEGVYGWLSGPTFETPAEINFLRHAGIDAVGMSTVPEAIALRHAGIELAGISCITNLGAGMGGETLSHEDVTRTGQKVEATFANLLSHLLPRL